MRYEDELPPEYRGGARKGGRATCCASSSRTAERCSRSTPACDYVIEKFNIPVRNALARAHATSPFPARWCAST